MGGQYMNIVLNKRLHCVIKTKQTKRTKTKHRSQRDIRNSTYAGTAGSTLHPGKSGWHRLLEDMWSDGTQSLIPAENIKNKFSIQNKEQITFPFISSSYLTGALSTAVHDPVLLILKKSPVLPAHALVFDVLHVPEHLLHHSVLLSLTDRCAAGQTDGQHFKRRQYSILPRVDKERWFKFWNIFFILCMPLKDVLLIMKMSSKEFGEKISRIY